MNIFAALSLFSFALSIGMGFFVFFRSPKSKINRAYFGMAILSGCQALVEFGYSSSQNFDQAQFWWKLDVLWPANIAFYLLIILYSTGTENWIKYKISRIAFLAITGGLIITGISTDFILGPPEKHAWGYLVGTFRQDNIIGNLAYFWLNTIWLIIIVLPFYRLFKTEKGTRERNQIKIIVYGNLTVTLYVLFHILRIILLSNFKPPI